MKESLDFLWMWKQNDFTSFVLCAAAIVSLIPATVFFVISEIRTFLGKKTMIEDLLCFGFTSVFCILAEAGLTRLSYEADDNSLFLPRIAFIVLGAYCLICFTFRLWSQKKSTKQTAKGD